MCAGAWVGGDEAGSTGGVPLGLTCLPLFMQGDLGSPPEKMTFEQRSGPWARSGFSEPQWERLQQILRVYRRSFTRDVREFVKMLRLDYPFEMQVSAGCELCPGNTSESFFHTAFQGKEIMSFQGTHWVPARDAPSWAGRATKELNQDQGTRKTLQWLLNDTCPQFLRGLLEAGKSELEKQEHRALQGPSRCTHGSLGWGGRQGRLSCRGQREWTVTGSTSRGGDVGCRVPALTPPTSLSDTVKPEAWLSAGRPPGPGRLLLVCHVSGFHPKPVWVMWMRGEQEQQGTRRGDVLPHADGTWYLRVTLDVAAREAAGLSCRVRHSSLGGQDIVLHWVHRSGSCW
ncbi:antigen-presenting glycoprotein CD1d-like isoform X2 [Mustela erminea]|uniref:antigen-presenting glycoprotein CD1d-like isoform X2 n=1 Tax=Mustela erminea TaxID=36723 RepID=UPI00138720DC|nr:antigen-presenting glycoprotein CD1d-like isoform X2 [Mustela erminea]